MTLHFLGSLKSSLGGGSAASQTLGSLTVTVCSLSSSSSLDRPDRAPDRRTEETFFRRPISRWLNSSTRDSVWLSLAGTSERSEAAGIDRLLRLFRWLLAKEKKRLRI